MTSPKPRRIAVALSSERLRRAGATVAAVAGGLVALDLIGLAVTLYYGPELLQAAEAAGVAGLLPQ